MSATSQGMKQIDWGREMAKHLAFNEFDMAGITNVVSRYKSAGLRADYDIADKAAGMVRIVFENPMRRELVSGV